MLSSFQLKFCNQNLKQPKLLVMWILHPRTNNSSTYKSPVSQTTNARILSVRYPASSPKLRKAIQIKLYSIHYFTNTTSNLNINKSLSWRNKCNILFGHLRFDVSSFRWWIQASNPPVSHARCSSTVTRLNERVKTS